MADLSLKEKLQPSLLDRLMDDSPLQQKESRASRIQSLSQQRTRVLRDLQWLMNTENAGTVHDLEQYPHVASSVINYGMPALAGRTLSAVDVSDIEQQLAVAIKRYEPRIMPDSVSIHASYEDEGASVNSLSFEIKGELWANPIPLKMFLRTQVDLETGHIQIQPVSEF